MSELRCSCGVRLAGEEQDAGLCSSCMWAEEMAFLEAAYAADLDERAKLSDASQEATQERKPGYGWAGIFM